MHTMPHCTNQFNCTDQAVILSGVFPNSALKLILNYIAAEVVYLELQE